MRKFSREQSNAVQAEIRRLLALGYPPSAIARSVGVSAPWVHAVRKKGLSPAVPRTRQPKPRAPKPSMPPMLVHHWHALTYEGRRAVVQAVLQEGAD